MTAVFRKVPEGYVGVVEELPGANTQGATLEEEARANLREAVALVIEVNKCGPGRPIACHWAQSGGRRHGLVLSLTHQQNSETITRVVASGSSE